jgi:hypothetical protein
MSEGIGQDAFIDEGELEDELANLEMEVAPDAISLPQSLICLAFFFSRDWMNK